MKDIIKVSRLLFLLIALFTIITICNFDSVEAKTNEKLIYQKFLRKEYKKQYSGSGAKRGFYLINLDGKGPRELILTRGEIGATGNSVFYVYAIKNRRVKQMHYFYHRSGCRSFNYSNKLKSINAETVSSTYFHADRYCYKHNKLRAKFGCSSEYSSLSKKIKYVIDRNVKGLKGYGGKTVSKAKYNKYYKKHYSSIKWKKYYMKELTPRNINAL